MLKMVKNPSRMWDTFVSIPQSIRSPEEWVSEWSHSVVSDSLKPHGPTMLLHPWDFPGKSTGVGSFPLHFLLQRSSQPRDRTWVSCIVGRRFTIWATREVGNGNPLQYFYLKNARQGNLVDYSPWSHKESDVTEWLSMHTAYKSEP